MEPFHGLLAFSGQFHLDPAPVAAATASRDEPQLLTSGDQRADAMMLGL